MRNLNDHGFLMKYIILQNDRIFIDICKHGCGSGCAYCYVETNNEPQVLLDMAQIKQICDYIKKHVECSKRIISLCPNTEPLKSKECVQRILYIIKFFLPLGCYIQISTKECVPEYFLKELQGVDSSKIYINISVPFLSNVEEIEPGAALIEKRLNVFKHTDAYPLINLCLYIKPFANKSIREQLEYVKIINEHNIKNVCVGVEFTDNTTDRPCISLYNKMMAADLFMNQAAQINEFVTILRNNTNANIFGSSICCIYNGHYDKCDLQLFEHDQLICEDCVIWRQKNIEGVK